MNDRETEMIYALAGGLEDISRRLHIQDLSGDTQAAVLSRFASVLFKKILLRVPDDRVGEIKAALSEGDADVFLSSLTVVIPDMQRSLVEVVSTLAASMQISQNME